MALSTLIQRGRQMFTKSSRMRFAISSANMPLWRKLKR
jgi:hypothetical protein